MCLGAPRMISSIAEGWFEGRDECLHLRRERVNYRVPVALDWCVDMYVFSHLRRRQLRSPITHPVKDDLSWSNRHSPLYDDIFQLDWPLMYLCLDSIAWCFPDRNQFLWHALTVFGLQVWELRSGDGLSIISHLALSLCDTSSHHVSRATHRVGHSM